VGPAARWHDGDALRPSSIDPQRRGDERAVERVHEHHPLLRTQKDESAVGVRVGVRRIGDARQVLDPRVVGLGPSDGRVLDVTWTRALDSYVGLAPAAASRGRGRSCSHIPLRTATCSGQQLGACPLSARRSSAAAPSPGSSAPSRAGEKSRKCLYEVSRKCRGIVEKCLGRSCLGSVSLGSECL